MKYRRTLKFHNLKRPRVRQTWNKYNLFNLYQLSRTRVFHSPRGTLFQQKWRAKSLTRGYHGEHIRERQWQHMFDRRLQSVVDMDPAYMARHDGSELAAGRGSGRDEPEEQAALQKLKSSEDGQEGGTRSSKRPTPYMQMTFAPLERRLDTAIFRALFASSARQARQFCVHGAVKVNGKKMPYPGYMLNPGDMFQVDVDRVMFATANQKRKVRASRSSSKAEEEPAEQESSGDAAEGSASGGLSAEKDMASLEKLWTRVQRVLAEDGNSLSTNNNITMQYLAWNVNNAVRRARLRHPELVFGDNTVDNLSTLFATLNVSDSSSASASTSASEVKSSTTPESAEASPSSSTTSPSANAEGQVTRTLTENDRAHLGNLLATASRNQYDPRRSFPTPWRPRDYLSPFAFIPRYLEVNQKICAAVYLRHPVSRPGNAEVPTPFPEGLSQLAHNWYLRRR